MTLVGHASWAERTLIDRGRFYPPDCKTPDARLRYYASIFPLIEVDSSYYAIPSQTNTHNWAARTPEGVRLQREGLPVLHRAPDRRAGAAA